jgi:Domain of unknown function (DUF4349)
MTHPDDTTATIERDLRAVDDALAAGAATDEDPLARELQELALALRAEAPEPEPRFAEELRGRMEAGFHARRRSARARWSAGLLPAGAALRSAGAGLRRRALPVAGIVIWLALIAAIVVPVGPEGSDDGADGDGDGGAIVGGSSEAGRGAAGSDSGGGASSQAAPGAGAPAELGRRAGQDGAAIAPAEPPVLPGTRFEPGRRDRKIERSIAMTLAAPDEEIPAVADGVSEVTSRHGGFVLRSNLSSDDEGATGSFELRIPSTRLREALADLAGLATVRSQSQTGQDVTREHVTAKDRLQAARAERRSLLRRLEAAVTDEEAEAIRRRLDLVAGEINGLRGQLRDLRLRTDYAIVTVDLEGEDGDSGSGAGSFDDAVGDAGELLVGLAGALIRILAIALPLGLIALIAWLTGRAFRRRRRESALA